VFFAFFFFCPRVALRLLGGGGGGGGGTALAVVAGSMIFNRQLLRLFGLPKADFWAGVLPPGVLAVGLAGPPALLAILVGLPHGRLAAAGLLAISVTLYVLPYWILATRRGLLPERLAFPLRRQGASASLPTA